MAANRWTIRIGYQHRSPARTESDGVLQAQGAVAADYVSDYLPGDIVAWSGRDMVERNIGEGPKIENVLFDWGDHRSLSLQDGQIV